MLLVMEGEGCMHLFIKSGQSFESLQEETFIAEPKWTLRTLKERIFKQLQTPEPAHMILVLQCEQAQQKLEGEDRTLFSLGLLSHRTIFVHSGKTWAAQQTAMDVPANEEFHHHQGLQRPPAGGGRGAVGDHHDEQQQHILADSLLYCLNDSCLATKDKNNSSRDNILATLLVTTCMELCMAELSACWDRRADAFRDRSIDSGATVGPILTGFRELLALAHVSRAFKKAFDSWFEKCWPHTVAPEYSSILDGLISTFREKRKNVGDRSQWWSESALCLVSVSSIISTYSYVSRGSSLIAPRGRYMLLELMHLQLPSPAASIAMFMIVKTWDAAASDLFRPRSKGEYCVLSLAARFCVLDAFQVLSNSATTASYSEFLQAPMKTPLREAVASGNKTVVRYILGCIGENDNNNHWTSWMGLAGCNCQLHHKNLNEAREFNSDDPIQLMKPVHSHGKWEDDLILVGLAQKQESIVQMLLERWPKRSDAPWILAVGDVHLESCIRNHCSVKMFERLLKLRTYVIPFSSPIVAKVLPPRKVELVNYQLWRCAIACKHVVLMKHLLSVPIFIWQTIRPTEDCLLDACHVQCSPAVEISLSMGQLLPTGPACIKAATNADAACLRVLLTHAKERKVLRQCLLYNQGTPQCGVLHALCRAEPALPKMLFDTFGVIFEAVSQKVSTRFAEEADDVTLDDLSWFDDDDQLPIHSATGPFHDMLARLFPADALWNQLEIPSHFLKKVATINEGEGSEASIVEWTYMSDCCHVAIKKYPKTDLKMQSIKREIGVMSTVRFPYILRILGWSSMDEGGSIGIISDLCSGNLHDTLTKNTDDICLTSKAKWALQIGAAIQYLHAQRPIITHGDVHPMNVLLSSGGSSSLSTTQWESMHAVLCDFDFSCISGTHTRVLKGVTTFPRFSHSNPEALSAESMQALDWFMFGMMLISVCFCGFFLFFKTKFVFV